MNLDEKDRLREAFLLATYQALGSKVGRDGTLLAIAMEQAKALEIEADKEEIADEVVLYCKRRGLVGSLTMQLGGGLTPAGVDHVEMLMRERMARQPQRPKPPPAPKVFGDWIRGDRIDEGGGGWIHKAYHKTDSERARPHALKILKKPERAPRFRKEIEAGLRLEHPNILRVLAHDLEAARGYYVAPYYRRGCLTFDHVKTLTPAERMRLFAAICRAVGYAHTNGVAHRDLKPENILLTDEGSPVVADFGLCYFLDPERVGVPRDTATLEQAGSRFYMAPELADGPAEQVTPRADVYSLGKLCYWMFAGTVFDREKLWHPSFNLTKREPITVHAHVYQLLERVVVEDPAGRLRDANEVAAMAEDLAERIAMDAHVLDLNIPQRCDFCKTGTYIVRVDPHWWSGSFRPGEGTGDAYEHAKKVCRDYGIFDTGKGAPWLVLQCGHCGHVQIFQLFMAPDTMKNWTLKK